MIGFDLETWPIGPKLAPSVILGAFNIRKSEALSLEVSRWATKFDEYTDEDGPREIYFFWADKLEDFLTLCERSEGPVVAHNGAFDWSCISAELPNEMGRIFQLFFQNKLECTYLRTLIFLNANGLFKTVGQSKVQLSHGKYGATSLVGACSFFCDLDLSEDKDHDVQVTYSKTMGYSFDKWWTVDFLEPYRKYLIQDVRHLPNLYYSQEGKGKVILKLGQARVNIFREAPRRATFHYTLTLASAWGLRVDSDAVGELRMKAEEEVTTVACALVAEGLAADLVGKARDKALEKGKLPIKIDQKAMQARLLTAFKSFGKEPPYTAKGTVKTSRDVLSASRDDLLVRWADVGNQKTIWSTFVPALEKSFSSGGVINTRFFPYSETGRISARNPNLLNPPREGGIRECIIARPNCCFIFCDYEANELRVLSQVLLDEFKRSRLAELYQEDPTFDPHTYMACKRINIPYEEGKRLKSAGDKKFKEERQLMKSCNFGFPGGMASRTFVQFAKAGYNIDVTEAEATDLKAFFFSQFPEIKDYLTRVGARVNNYDGQGYLTRVGRLSGDRRFCQLANFYFQGLAAEGGLSAFAVASRLAYTDPTSPLYGTRPVLFIHDEIIIETPLHKAHDAAMELKYVMESNMQYYTPDIPSLAEPTLATRWWKGAYQKFDDAGRLVPSDI